MSAAITDSLPSAGGREGLRRVAIGGMLLGLVPFAASLFGHTIGSGWTALALAFGPFLAFAFVYFFARYWDTTPGIKNDGVYFGQFSSRKAAGVALGVVLTGFYVLLYWFPQYLGFTEWGKEAGGAIALLEPLSQAVRGGHADQWFLYGFLYTVAVVTMGARMLFRYRHNRYEIFRTISVMFFQLGFGFLIPAILLRFNQPEFYFTYFWPLKPEYLFPSKVSELTQTAGGVGTFMISWGIIMSFIMTPLLTYLYGKRWYCSWVCGCGGLAETAGDPFRQLSSKKTSAWKFERWSIHTVLVLIVGLTAVLWLDLGEFSLTYKKWYGFFVGAMLSGVVGVGFYPLLGSRVWCRFFCPMAAILGIGQRFASRFRITTNGDQCMSCGNCSTYCEMGIDVRAYAMNGKNIVRASCVGCGICAAVCPRGVLKLENGKTHKDRFEGADNPLADLIGALKKR